MSSLLLRMSARKPRAADASLSLELSRSTVNVTTPGTSAAPAENITVRDAAGLPLGAVYVSAVSYVSGSGWLTGLTVTPVGGQATIAVVADGAGNSGQTRQATFVVRAFRGTQWATATVTVNMTVPSSPAVPTMALSQASVQLTASEGGSTVSAQVVVSSANGEALGATSVGTITGAGAAAFSTSVAGKVVTITGTVGARTAGVYSATVPILDSLASNSPQNVTVDFTITAVGTPTSVVQSQIINWASPVGSQSLFCSGWVFPPGYFTVADHAARKFSLWIGGVEQSIATKLKPGLHPDGSVRAIDVQFLHTPASSSPTLAEVRLGTTRGTTDLAWTTTTKDHHFVEQAAQAWGVDAEPTGKLLPTDVAYLCACDAAFMPLQPATEDDAVSTGRFTTLLQQMAAQMETLTANRANSLVPQRFQSTYETPRALIAAWCRTGNANLLRYALRLGWRLLEYGHPVPSYTKFSPHPNVYGETRMLGTSDANVGFGEPYTLRYVSYAACWQLSGYATFFTEVNRWHQQHNSAAREVRSTALALSGDTGWITQNYIIRSNTINILPAIVAYMIGANRRMTTQSGYGNRDMNFPVAFSLYLDALQNVTYAKGDYRDGFVGQNPAATDNNTVPAGQFPNFQVEIINAAVLMLFEREVYADPRIANWIKTNTSIVLQNVKALNGTAVPPSRGYGYTDSGLGLPYSATDVAGQGKADCDFFGHITASLAYCAAKWPTDVVAGATFRQWYDRAADYKNNADVSSVQQFDWSKWDRAHKVFGEMFGVQQCAPYFLNYGVPAGAPAVQTVTPPTTWPG